MSMSLVCTSEYLSVCTCAQQYLYFDQYHLLTLNCWKICCLFYSNQMEVQSSHLFINHWDSSISCSLFLWPNIHWCVHFTFNALWITSFVVPLWGPWCDKQADCHGNPPSLTLTETAARTLPLCFQTWHFKAPANAPFPFQRLVPIIGGIYAAKLLLP